MATVRLYQKIGITFSILSIILKLFEKLTSSLAIAASGFLTKFVSSKNLFVFVISQINFLRFSKLKSGLRGKCIYFTGPLNDRLSHDL